MGLGKIFTKKVCPVTGFFAVQTISSFWWVLEKFSQKSVPSHMFLRYGDYLKFWMGLRKVLTKMCAQLHVFSLWRLTWVFDATWKVSTKKVWPVTRFFAVETILSFWWDLESFDKKVWSVTRFFAVQAISSFWWDLEKFSQKSVPSYTFCSLWRLTWVFDGTWKNFHKKVCPVIYFFAMETILSFGWDLEKFCQKCVPSYTFFRCGD